MTSEVLLENVKAKEKQLVNKENLSEAIAADTGEVFVSIGAGDIDKLVKPIKEALVRKYELE